MTPRPLRGATRPHPPLSPPLRQIALSLQLGMSPRADKVARRGQTSTRIKFQIYFYFFFLPSPLRTLPPPPYPSYV